MHLLRPHKVPTEMELQVRARNEAGVTASTVIQLRTLHLGFRPHQPPFTAILSLLSLDLTPFVTPMLLIRGVVVITVLTGLQLMCVDEVSAQIGFLGVRLRTIRAVVSLA